MKTFEEFLAETVISYPLTGKKRHLPKGKAMAKRSSSSAGAMGIN